MSSAPTLAPTSAVAPTFAPPPRPDGQINNLGNIQTTMNDAAPTPAPVRPVVRSATGPKRRVMPRPSSIEVVIWVKESSTLTQENYYEYLEEKGVPSSKFARYWDDLFRAKGSSKGEFLLGYNHHELPECCGDINVLIDDVHKARHRKIAPKLKDIKNCE
jgi:hypothetical protein